MTYKPLVTYAEEDTEAINLLTKKANMHRPKPENAVKPDGPPVKIMPYTWHSSMPMSTGHEVLIGYRYRFKDRWRIGIGVFRGGWEKDNIPVEVRRWAYIPYPPYHSDNIDVWWGKGQMITLGEFEKALADSGFEVITWREETFASKNEICFCVTIRDGRISVEAATYGRALESGAFDNQGEALEWMEKWAR